MGHKPLAKDLKSEYFKVDSRRLVEEEGFNRRENYGDLKKLAAGIKAGGLDMLDPLWCYKRGEEYVVVKGHRRRRALKILEQEGEILMVKIMMVPKGYSKEMLILDQATGNEGLAFSPWEKAAVVRDLRGLGWDAKMIAERSGWSTVYVRRLLSLADAPQRLINCVREGKCSATEAMDNIAEGEEAVKALIEKAEAGKAIPQETAPELFPPEDVKPERVTKKDLKPNSIKVWKKWIKQSEPGSRPKRKVEEFEFVMRLLEGQVTKEELDERYY